MLRVIIEPNDVLFFRGLKHFTAGMDHTAKSELPLPQTIAGALRSKILVEQDFSAEAKELVGYGKEEPEDKNSRFIEIAGTFLWDRQELFATPMDVGKVKNDKYAIAKPKEAFGLNFFYPPIEPGGFIPLRVLLSYLRGEIEVERIGKEIRNLSSERRVGIMLGTSRTAEEEMLYSAEFLRINGISVWVEKLEFLPKKGLLKVGGEGRFARYKIDENNSFVNLKKFWEKIRDSMGGRMKIYVATPMLLRESDKYGWNPENYIEKIGIKVKKIVPLLGKPVKVGGWDMANNRPRGVRYAVPAGSLYFVEFDGELGVDKPYIKLGELTKLGYGLCFLGVW